MTEPELLTLTPENLPHEHLCCIIRTKKPHPGVETKRAWLAERLREGHVFRKLDVKGCAFIEYAPLETAWVPVLGKGYLYIYCLWVQGAPRGHGWGRRLLEGAKTVKLFGEEIAVKAKIVNFQGLSSHADHDHLVQWIKAFDPKPTHVFVVHGDEDVAPVFAEELNSLGFHAHAAKFTECYDLAANEMVSEGYISERKRTAQKSRADNLYAKLVAAAESLLEFAKRCKGRPNKDISALTGQIISLIERFRE